MLLGDDSRTPFHDELDPGRLQFDRLDRTGPSGYRAVVYQMPGSSCMVLPYWLNT